MRHRSLLPSFCKIAEGQRFQQQSKEDALHSSSPSLYPVHHPLTSQTPLDGSALGRCLKGRGGGRKREGLSPRGRREGGKGQWCPGEGQPGWKEPHGDGLPSSAQIPGEMGPLGPISTLHGVGRPYYGGSEGAQPKRPISLPKYQQYWVVGLGARVQMDLFLDDSQEGKTEIAFREYAGQDHGQRRGGSGTRPPGFPEYGRQRRKGSHCRATKYFTRNFLPAPLNQQAHLAIK